ncbi:hypothetical protein BCR33DRAFT_741531 [Rhizoclosmatium globosum]|uniref:Uncharacterized protein n=1 Tax=Rhizoclosmatium globosum TaxID=329046 RepID=A0A1Y2BVA2_9FUNG|nr:hypothetical protein BCR33DRAFT_741531 [Rhizoclosmatium globosum]|eukprot:ORY38691.1 hypothetical protein BCR33DRAFT_741531 [Rhizoclosmatium globosum]
MTNGWKLENKTVLLLMQADGGSALLEVVVVVVVGGKAGVEDTVAVDVFAVVVVRSSGCYCTEEEGIEVGKMVGCMAVWDEGDHWLKRAQAAAVETGDSLNQKKQKNSFRQRAATRADSAAAPESLSPERGSKGRKAVATEPAQSTATASAKPSTTTTTTTVAVKAIRGVTHSAAGVGAGAGAHSGGGTAFSLLF